MAPRRPSNACTASSSASASPTRESSEAAERRGGWLAKRRSPGRLRAILADAVGAIGLGRGLTRRPLANRGGLAVAALYWGGDMLCLWAALRVPLAAALVGVFAYRFFTFWLPLLPAALVVPSLPGLRGRLREAARRRSEASH